MTQRCDCDHCEICPICFPKGFDTAGNRVKTDEQVPPTLWTQDNMTKLTPVISDHHKDQAEAVLLEAIEEMPDSVIVLCFFNKAAQFKIKVSTIPDRLSLIGALEEAKNKIITDGYVS